MILTRHMVGHKVDYQLQAGLMHSLHQRLKLRHTVGHTHRQVGRNVVVVFDGIRRASFALHHPMIVRTDAVATIVGSGGVFYHSGKPHVSHAQLSY